ncbi:MAG: DNA gyrase subunit A [Puniceicoccales bacterium]|jgi:DNA gyrase subunit A|nr:DNA gyrase subunit A [Puniceicoccales bacterium]
MKLFYYPKVMQEPKEKVISTNITEVMQRSYIDYSMSVIVSRALPDVRDGLKPVQRRVLYAMLREGLISSRPFDKCAGVVGEVLKNYHPHGDSSVYETLVRLGQNWVMRCPLITPQGNFGSIDGDPPAAYRYTECKLEKISEEMLRDIDEETVDFQPNYKESTVEPTVLPSALPNLLMNGSTGIAVGMTTNIPPHNLGELIDALCRMIDDPRTTVDDLCGIIRGPDFPTGGSVIGLENIQKYLRTGRGIIRNRGVIEVESQKNGREQLVIRTVPYNTNRAAIVTKIAELINEKIIDEASDLRDESDENTRIVIELKRNESPRVVINKLFKLTPMESSFGVILLALDKRRPKQMNIKEMLECYLDHRREVIFRRIQFRLRKAEARAHILEGYKIALTNLDNFVKIIRQSPNRDAAKVELMAKYPLSDRQADAILELRLYQLTGMEQEKIDEEYGELIKTIGEYRHILNDEQLLLGVIRREFVAVKELYATPRLTQILPAEDEFRIEDVIAREGCIITTTENGFIKRTENSAYRSQRRGGKGVIGAGQRDDDRITNLLSASTHDHIMFVMTNGRIYIEKVYEIPEGSRTSKGRSLVNVIEMQGDEKMAAMICFPEFTGERYLIMCTKKGVTKKTNLNDYVNYRRGGIIGIDIDDGDYVIEARLSDGQNELVLITHRGISIRFSEQELRDQGRATRGVRGIALREGDYVVAMTIVDNDATFLVAAENGQGKRSSFDSYRLQKRAGLGVIAIKMAKNVGVAAALTVNDGDEIMMITERGQAVRSPVKGIRVIGRTTQGVRLINLEKGDHLMGVSRITEVEDSIDENNPEKGDHLLDVNRTTTEVEDSTDENNPEKGDHLLDVNRSTTEVEDSTDENNWP